MKVCSFSGLEVLDLCYRVKKSFVHTLLCTNLLQMVTSFSLYLQIEALFLNLLCNQQSQHMCRYSHKSNQQSILTIKQVPYTPIIDPTSKSQSQLDQQSFFPRYLIMGVTRQNIQRCCCNKAPGMSLCVERSAINDPQSRDIEDVQRKGMRRFKDGERRLSGYVASGHLIYLTLPCNYDRALLVSLCHFHSLEGSWEVPLKEFELSKVRKTSTL